MNGESQPVDSEGTARRKMTHLVDGNLLHQLLALDFDLSVFYQVLHHHIGHVAPECIAAERQGGGYQLESGEHAVRLSFPSYRSLYRP